MYIHTKEQLEKLYPDIPTHEISLSDVLDNHTINYELVLDLTVSVITLPKNTNAYIDDITTGCALYLYQLLSAELDTWIKDNPKVELLYYVGWFIQLNMAKLHTLVALYYYLTTRKTPLSDIFMSSEHIELILYTPIGLIPERKVTMDIVDLMSELSAKKQITLLRVLLRLNNNELNDYIGALNILPFIRLTNVPTPESIRTAINHLKSGFTRIACKI